MTNTIVNVIWKEPPPPNEGNHRGRSKYARVVDELKAHPGEWALIVDTLKKTTSPPLHFQGPEFERAYRVEYPAGVQHHRIYCRYIGGNNE